MIGNPPYVDIKSLPPCNVREYFRIYKTAENRINLYSIFIERGKSLLNFNGTLCFINPNSILINQSYKKIREFIIDDLFKLVKLPDKMFASATVETIVLILRNNCRSAFITGAYFKNDDLLDFKNLSYGLFSRDSWKRDIDSRFNIFSDKKIQNLLAKIETDMDFLENYVYPSLGITPYDSAKGHTKQMIDDRVFHSEKKLSNEYVPLISGKNIEKYNLLEGVKEYLRYGNWLGAPRDEKFFTSPKIIIRQILGGRELEIIATYTEDAKYFTQIGFSLISKTRNNEELKYLLGIINSKLISFYHKYKFLDVEKMVFQKILIANCRKFPIKRSGKGLKMLIASAVNDILTKNKSEIDSVNLKSKVDNLVYKLYDLTHEEILLIDPKFSLSQSEYVNLKIG